MVYHIHIHPAFAEQHRHNSIILFKTLWTNLAGLFGRTPRRFEFSWGTFTVENYEGLGWILLPILPFSVLHENLHILVAFFTPRDKPIRLIAPIFDLFYLPLSLVSIMFGHITIGFFLAWVWITKLMNNVTGDFSMTKNNESQKPETEEPEIAEPVTTVP